MTGTIATADQLFASGGKRRFDTVDLPVAGLTVRIRSLTERELSNYQARIQSSRDEQQRHNRLAASNRQFIALCVVDDDGNPVIEPNQVGRLMEMDGADSSHLYDACARHCGVTAQDLDELVKNSGETIPSGSPTNSPTPSES